MKDSAAMARPGVAAAALTIAVALTSTVARAQTPAQKAKQGLSWFSWYLTNGQIDGGENVARLMGDSGMVWHDANTTEMLADYTLATGDRSFVSNLQAYGGFDGNCIFGTCTTFLGWSPFGIDGENDVNDDKLWWALAMIRVYDVLNDRTFLNNAESIFQNVCQSWALQARNCGGGILWKQDGDPYLNSVTNELFLETAAKLALRDPGAKGVCQSVTITYPPPQVGNPPGSYQPPKVTVTPLVPTVTSPAGHTRQWDDTYPGWAAAQWEWFKQHWFPGATQDFDQPPNTSGHMPIVDGLGADCVLGHPWNTPNDDAASVSTYNQGVILGALLDLATLRGTPAGAAVIHDDPDTLVRVATSIANATFATLTASVDGKWILTEIHGCGPPDCPGFKGIFTRYLGRLVAGVDAAKTGCFMQNALQFLDDNAAQVWKMGVTDDGMFPEQWDSTTPVHTTAQHEGYSLYQAAQTSGLDLLIADIHAPIPACGGEGQSCCCNSSQACGSGLVCKQGTPSQCVACGGAGQPCCPGGANGGCAANGTLPLSCIAGQCAVCGNYGQPCCPAAGASGCIAPPLTCGASGVCSCGSTADRCGGNGDCCSQQCQSGQCKCGGTGTHCSKSGDCCSARCGASGTCDCLPTGSSCTSAFECCGPESSCTQGRCTAYTPPATCNGKPRPTTACKGPSGVPSWWHCCGNPGEPAPQGGWVCGLCQ